LGRLFFGPAAAENRCFAAMNVRQLFQQHLAPTSPAPVGLHIVHAAGSRLTDAAGKEYIDLIGGISVCNIGHRHPAVVQAIRDQADAYLHVMVYGELIQSPQAEYAALLASNLPAELDCVYFTNSGAEATEGAIKLARRITGRPQIVAAVNSYHGNTTGALALMGDEYWRNAFRPLMPGVLHHAYNSKALIDAITDQTACVVLETIQAEAGVIAPAPEWLQAVRMRCTETGALLILDEIQCGFGRTGTLWGFEQFGVVPDMVLLGKALGAGMPLGAFVSSNRNMQALTANPVLGHLTTFGGHPVSCAAGLAGLRALLEEDLIATVEAKAERFRELLQHPAIRAVRNRGLLMAVELEGGAEQVLALINGAIAGGVFSDWFLFAADCIRIAPPLNISDADVRQSCRIILDVLDSLTGRPQKGVSEPVA
jgi:acetylornithine/succinyldiaminopimelate/putrescine aminotransferase